MWSRARSALAALVLTLLFFCPTTFASEVLKPALDNGSVVVEYQEQDGIKFVKGTIIIDEAPDKVWPVLANPFEFEGKICPRMKSVKVIADETHSTVLDCTIKVFFPIPDICYIVESKYVPGQRVDFHRIRGSFKDFRGYWSLAPQGTNKSMVTYAVFVDTGLPVPEWLVRQAVRIELPTVLTGLRHRVHSLKDPTCTVEKRSILAAVTPINTDQSASPMKEPDPLDVDSTPAITSKVD